MKNEGSHKARIDADDCQIQAAKWKRSSAVCERQSIKFQLTLSQNSTSAPKNGCFCLDFTSAGPYHSLMRESAFEQLDLEHKFSLYVARLLADHPKMEPE